LRDFLPICSYISANSVSHDPIHYYNK